MMSAWGLLAFFKATDTRENASFATSMKQRRRVSEKSSQMVRPADGAFDFEKEDAEDEEN